jgi:hypothetical protein
MASKRVRARSWGWVFTVLAVGACGGSVLHQGDQDDEADPSVSSGGGGSASGGRAQSSGGSMRAVGSGEGGNGGNRPYVPPKPPSCDGGRLDFSCDRHQEVVCSWQRVWVPDEYASGGTGGTPDPCDAAEPLFDPTGAPQGGAGGDYPGRNACAGYVLSSGEPDPLDACSSTYEDEAKQCNILGHCCVLVDIKYCGP